jgi:hypothetical protein
VQLEIALIALSVTNGNLALALGLDLDVAMASYREATAALDILSTRSERDTIEEVALDDARAMVDALGLRILEVEEIEFANAMRQRDADHVEHERAES